MRPGSPAGQGGDVVLQVRGGQGVGGGQQAGLVIYEDHDGLAGGQLYVSHG